MTKEQERERWQTLRGQILELKERNATTYWELGKKFLEVRKGNLWRLSGFKSFEDYVEREVGYRQRQAYYLMEVWHYFGEYLGNPGVIEKLRTIGWTKTRLLVNLVDANNVDEWIATAKKTPLTQFEAVVKDAKAKKMAREAKATASAAARASGGGGGGGGGGRSVPSVHPDMAQAGRIKSVKFILNDEMIEQFEIAVRHAKTITGSDALGYNVAQVMLDYNASRDWSAGTRKNIAETMGLFEKQLKARIIVLDGLTNEVLYGQEHMDSTNRE
jgi:hypothetical protein